VLHTAAHAITWNEPQLAAMLQEHVAGRLLRVDANAICFGTRVSSKEVLVPQHMCGTENLRAFHISLQRTIGDDGAGCGWHLELQSKTTFTRDDSGRWRQAIHAPQARGAPPLLRI
jgi:hypothetical protein